jgi:hypothetical protein
MGGGRVSLFLRIPTLAGTETNKCTFIVGIPF